MYGRLRWLGSGAALCAALHGAPAAAQIRVQVPEGCGSEEEFARELERLLGPDAAEAQPLSVVISPPDESGTYKLHIELRNGVRDLYHVDCRTLFRSAVVVAAVSVRPDIEAQESSTPESPPPSTAAPSAPQPSPPSPRSHPTPLVDRARPSQIERSPAPVAPSTPKAAAVQASVAAGGGVVVGVVPGVAGLLDLGGAVDHGRWGAGLEFWVLPGTTKPAGADPGVDVSGAAVAACARFSPVGFVRASVGVRVHRLTGGGTGVRQSLTDSVWSVAPMVELTGVSPRLGGATLELGVQAQWAVAPASFQVSGFGEVYRQSPFGAAGVARAVWHFP